jgi:hypothetical protein
MPVRYVRPWTFWTLGSWVRFLLEVCRFVCSVSIYFKGPLSVSGFITAEVILNRIMAVDLISGREERIFIGMAFNISNRVTFL